MRALLILPIALVLAAGQIPGTPEQPSVGALAGTVLDGTGQPLADATVVAQPEKNMVKELRTQTDAQGRFVLTNIPAGGVYVDAFKESEGYPYTRFAFLIMPGHGPYDAKVMINPGETTTGAVIRLGVKAAILKFRITDEKGRPIGANAEFERPDLGTAPNSGRSIASDQTLLVPPVPFRMTVSTEGYAPWHFGGEKWRGDEGLIRLQSGETLELAIRLRLGDASPTATTGSIKGTVFGPDEEPLAGAPVEANRDSDSSQRRLATATAAGTFIMDGVLPGTYHVWAWKGELGYGSDMSSPFFIVPGREAPVVTVSAGEVAPADIHLGPKNAGLHILITDQQGRPIRDMAHVTISRPDVPDTLEKDVRGRALIAVPPTQFRVSVKADGFADWHYGGQKWQDAAGLISVSSGDIVDLQVQLAPVP
jgi:hypothetical protein